MKIIIDVFHSFLYYNKSQSISEIDSSTLNGLCLLLIKETIYICVVGQVSF